MQLPCRSCSVLLDIAKPFPPDIVCHVCGTKNNLRRADKGNRQQEQPHLAIAQSSSTQIPVCAIVTCGATPDKQPPAPPSLRTPLARYGPPCVALLLIVGILLIAPRFHDHEKA